jgi:hypothetical protein
LTCSSCVHPCANCVDTESHCTSCKGDRIL